MSGKIDDFEAGRHGQQSWPGRSNEANLNKLAEELRGTWLQKGDFNGHWIFASASEDPLTLGSVFDQNNNFRENYEEIIAPSAPGNRCKRNC